MPARRKPRVTPRPGSRPAPDSPPADPHLGLTAAEARARHAAGLGNDYRAPTSRTYWEIFRDNSYPYVNGPLLAISAVLVAFGSYVEAVMTAGPVATNIGIGVVQGARAKQKLDHVALLTRPHAVLVRDGVEQEVDPVEVVLGDVVVARRGDEIQLDGRILGDERAWIDASALTGEADAVEKQAGDEVLSGSAVISGTARYLVEAVGAATFANRILTQAKGRRDARTPLQTDVARAILALAFLILVSSVLVVLTVGIAPDGSPKEAVNAAAVLVTLVPQGLAIMLTVTYAVAALRISRLGALAQRQSAIEAISRIDTFCTDKTGTLTTRRLRLGTVEAVGSPADAARLETWLGVAAASTTTPNDTTTAIAAAFPQPRGPLAGEVPFASSLRWSAIRLAAGREAVPPVRARTDAEPAADPFRPDAGETLVLGAPAVLLPATTGDPRAIEARVSEHASTGARVLLFARGSRDAPLVPGADAAIPGPLEPLAIVTLIEELRPEAKETLAGFRERGIEVKVVSGDDPRTVEAISRRMGLEPRGAPASGLELSALDDAALAESAERTSIFGRVDPDLKARLVDAFRAGGRFVAMTGDGVNDILPVRRANVGIALQSGSPATRGVADLVLVHDDFSILPEAFRDGQRIVAAMSVTLIVLLARTFYCLLIILGAAAAGLAFPLTPRQNSILAFVTVGVPVIVLALWVEPRPTGSNLLGRTLRVSIPVSIGVAAVAVPVYATALASGATVEAARTIVTTVASFMGIGLLALIPVRPERGRLGIPGRSRTLLLVGTMVLAYLAVISVDIGRDFFELEALPVEIMVTLGVIAILWTITVLLVQRTGIVDAASDSLVVAWGRLMAAVRARLPLA